LERVYQASDGVVKREKIEISTSFIADAIGEAKAVGLSVALSAFWEKGFCEKLKIEYVRRT